MAIPADHRKILRGLLRLRSAPERYIRGRALE